MGSLLHSGVSWRHLLYAVLHFPWALFSFVVSVVFWSVGWALLLYPLWQWVFPRYLDQPGIQFADDGHALVRSTAPLETRWPPAPPASR